MISDRTYLRLTEQEFTILPIDVRGAQIWFLVSYAMDRYCMTNMLRATGTSVFPVWQVKIAMYQVALFMSTCIIYYNI